MACHEHNACVEHVMAQAEAICEKKQLRFTAIRRQVLEWVWMSHRPMKAYDLLKKLDDVDASAKPPTVYRALDFLQANGLVHKLNSLNAYVGCTHPEVTHRCYFIICNRCNVVEECCDSKISDAIDVALKGREFSANNVVLEVDGICADCKEKASA